MTWQPTMRIGYDDADRLISYPRGHNLSMKQQPIRVDTMRGNRCTTSACDALAAEQCNATPHRAIPTYPVQYPRATSTIKNPDSTASVEDTGGSGGHGRASRSTTPSRQARVWRSRGRPGPTAPGTPAALQATTSSAERSSRRGRLAGGPPPTGAPSSRAQTHTKRRPEHQRCYK